MFHVLDYSSETKKIGPEYPQIQKMKIGYDFKTVNSVYKLARCNKELPEFRPDLDGFLLHNKSKITDFLSNVFTAPNGFLVSENVKNILQKYQLPIHKFYPIKLYSKNDIHSNYYWFHLICDLTDNINYPKSIFFLYENYSNDLGRINISSKEDFLLKRSQVEEKNKGQNITIWSKQLEFITPPVYDFFKIGLFDSKIYITEKLKNDFENNGILGVQFSSTTLK